MKRKAVISAADRAAFGRIGAIGGKASGACKRRGDSEYYKQLAKKRATKGK